MLVRACILGVLLLSPDLLTACSKSPPPLPPTASDTTAVTVLLNHLGYALGDTALVKVANPGGRTILFSIYCDGFVEGRADTTWETVFEPDCSNVRVRPTILGPGEFSFIPFVVSPCGPEDLPRFEAFRMRLRFQFPEGGYREVFSPEFSVAAR